MISYYVEGIFKGLSERKVYSKSKEQEYTFNYIILESDTNLTHIEQIQYSAERYPLDELELTGKTVLCPVYIDHVLKGDKVFKNVKLVGEIIESKI